jgi:hypothetical protein
MLLTILRKIREKGLGWTICRSGQFIAESISVPVHCLQTMRAKRLASKAAFYPRTSGQVVFVVDQLHLRMIKLAYALRESGWQVILLCRNETTPNEEGYFAEVHRFRYSGEALRLAAGYTAQVYHVFSCWDFEVASLFIRHKPGKVVFDNFDLLTGMVRDEVLNSHYSGRVSMEQYCYRNADGLCCRDLQTQYLKKELGYVLPQRIFFPEYCWPETKLNRSARFVDAIHVVYVGNLDLDPDSPVGYQYELAAILSENGIHFHIYPWTLQYIDELTYRMSSYIKDCGNPQLIHIHPTVPADQLVEELSKYHYGILISTKNVDFGEEHDTYYPHKEEFFMASKIFDYMEARLYSLIQNARLPRSILHRCGGGKVVHCMDDIVAHCLNEPFREPDIPESYRIMANIDRLIAFYQSL